MSNGLLLTFGVHEPACGGEMVQCLGLEVHFYTLWLHDSCVIMNSTVPSVFGADLLKQIIFKHFFSALLSELTETTKSALYINSKG